MRQGSPLPAVAAYTIAIAASHIRRWLDPNLAPRLCPATRL
jgi:hypothetical protein